MFDLNLENMPAVEEEMDDKLKEFLVRELGRSFVAISFDVWYYLCKKTREKLTNSFPDMELDPLTEEDARLWYTRYCFHCDDNCLDFLKSVITGYPSFKWPKEVDQLIKLSYYKAEQKKGVVKQEGLSKEVKRRKYEEKVYDQAYNPETATSSSSFTDEEETESEEIFVMPKKQKISCDVSLGHNPEPPQSASNENRSAGEDILTTSKVGNDLEPSANKYRSQNKILDSIVVTIPNVPTLLEKADRPVRESVSAVMTPGLTFPNLPVPVHFDPTKPPPNFVRPTAQSQQQIDLSGCIAGQNTTPPLNSLSPTMGSPKSVRSSGVLSQDSSSNKLVQNTTTQITPTRLNNSVQGMTPLGAKTPIRSLSSSPLVATPAKVVQLSESRVQGLTPVGAKTPIRSPSSSPLITTPSNLVQYSASSSSDSHSTSSKAEGQNSWEPQIPWSTPRLVLELSTEEIEARRAAITRRTPYKDSDVLVERDEYKSDPRMNAATNLLLQQCLNIKKERATMTWIDFERRESMDVHRMEEDPNCFDLSSEKNTDISEDLAIKHSRAGSQGQCYANSSERYLDELQINTNVAEEESSSEGEDFDDDNFELNYDRRRKPIEEIREKGLITVSKTIFEESQNNTRKNLEFATTTARTQTFNNKPNFERAETRMVTQVQDNYTAQAHFISNQNTSEAATTVNPVRIPSPSESVVTVRLPVRQTSGSGYRIPRVPNAPNPPAEPVHPISQPFHLFQQRDEFPPSQPVHPSSNYTPHSQPFQPAGNFHPPNVYRTRTPQSAYNPGPYPMNNCGYPRPQRIRRP